MRELIRKRIERIIQSLSCHISQLPVDQGYFALAIGTITASPLDMPINSPQV
jgi:hypothetical protein